MIARFNWYLDFPSPYQLKEKKIRILTLSKLDPLWQSVLDPHMAYLLNGDATYITLPYLVCASIKSADM